MDMDEPQPLIKIQLVNARMELSGTLDLLKIAVENKQDINYDDGMRFCWIAPKSGHGRIWITKKGFQIIGACSEEEARKELERVLKSIKLFYIEKK